MQKHMEKLAMINWCLLKESKNHRRAKGEPQELVSHSRNICNGKHVKTISQYQKKMHYYLNGGIFHPLCWIRVKASIHGVHMFFPQIWLPRCGWLGVAILPGATTGAGERFTEFSHPAILPQLMNQIQLTTFRFLLWHMSRCNASVSSRIFD